MRAKGHGHVVPREDGSKASCGGPTKCKVCQREQAEYDEFLRILPGVTIETLPDGTQVARGIRLKTPAEMLATSSQPGAHMTKLEDKLFDAEHALIEATEDFLHHEISVSDLNGAYKVFAEARAAWCEADQAEGRPGNVRTLKGH